MTLRVGWDSILTWMSTACSQILPRAGYMVFESFGELLLVEEMDPFVTITAAWYCREIRFRSVASWCTRRIEPRELGSAQLQHVEAESKMIRAGNGHTDVDRGDPPPSFGNVSEGVPDEAKDSSTDDSALST
jgi:hypothetical protein